MHTSYVPPGMVDESVVRKQAEDRFRATSEMTWVHMHRYREACASHSCYQWPNVEVVQ